VGQDVRVWNYDDLEGKDSGVEATHVKIPLAFGDWSGTIDLGDRNFGLLAAALAPYLEVGNGRYKAPRPRGRRPNEYYTALRQWLHDEHGIDLVASEEGKYDYPKDLRAQFDKTYDKQEVSPGADSVG
jgi:hypothetical protein